MLAVLAALAVLAELTGTAGGRRREGVVRVVFGGGLCGADADPPSTSARGRWASRSVEHRPRGPPLIDSSTPARPAPGQHRPQATRRPQDCRTEGRPEGEAHVRPCGRAAAAHAAPPATAMWRATLAVTPNCRSTVCARSAVGACSVQRVRVQSTGIASHSMHSVQRAACAASDQRV